MKYKVNAELFVEDIGNERFSDLKMGEDYRVIGGDNGDIHFHGFYTKKGKTFLVDPYFSTTLHLNEDEVDNHSLEVLKESYDSIGVECLY